ncbi:MAG: hypothetical protein QF724_05680 [Planctomycetota bacterium]|jgi:hypothetical protein|nr:hypothetical protein [Planctomycetota bacterium]
MLWLLLCLALQAPPAIQDRGAPDERDERLLLDELLELGDPQAGPLMSTGRLLAMERLRPVPGLVGRLALGAAFPADQALVRIEFSTWGALITPTLVQSAHHPSHLRRVFDLGGGLRLLEHAFITGDDAALVLLRLENGGQEERELELLFSSDLTLEPDRSQSRQHPIGLAQGARTFSMMLDGVEFALTSSPGGAPAVLASGALPLPDVGGARAVLHLLIDGRCSADLNGAEVLLSDGSRLSLAAATTRELATGAPLAAADTKAAIATWTAPPGRFFRRLLVGRAHDENGESDENGVYDEKGESDGSTNAPGVLAATLEVLPDVGRPPVLRGTLAAPGGSRALHATLVATDTVVVTDKYPYRGSAGLGSSNRQPARQDGDTRSANRAPKRAGGRRGLLAHLVLAPGETRTMTCAMALAGRSLVSFLQAMGRTEDPQALTRQADSYTRWFTENVPTFACSNPHVERSWWLGWVELRRRLVSTEGRGLSGGLILCQREPRALARAAALPDLVANLRWLRDDKLMAEQLRTFARRPVPAAVGLDGLALAAPPGADQAAPTRSLLRALDLLAPENELRSLAEVVTAPPGEGLAPSARLNKPGATPDEILRRLTGLEFLPDGSLQLTPDPGALDHFRFDGIKWDDAELAINWNRPGGRQVDERYPQGLTIWRDGESVHGSSAPVPVVLRRSAGD